AAPLIGGNMSIAEGDVELAAGVDGILGNADDVDLVAIAAGLDGIIGTADDDPDADLTTAQDYYIISANGSLTAAALTFEGDFFLIVTQTDDGAGTVDTYVQL